MKKLFIDKIPWIEITWKTLDLRKWYYVWIDGYLCSWWACEFELDEVREDYEEHGQKVKFKKIPWWKTLIK